MRRAKYLNAVLTINAVALCLLVVILATERGAWLPAATAAEQQIGIRDAGALGYVMMRELRRISSGMEDLRKDLERREFNVKVVSMPPAPTPTPSE